MLREDKLRILVKLHHVTYSRDEVLPNEILDLNFGAIGKANDES